MQYNLELESLVSQQQTPQRLLPPIQPLTARSVVLSTLLGYDPPVLPLRALIRVGGLFDIPERTTRQAINRMVADGELAGDRSSYRLTDRLSQRQRHQREGCLALTKPWDGSWEIAVVTSAGRPLPERVNLRKVMFGLRLAELREGVWTRPANLHRGPTDLVMEDAQLFDAVPNGSPGELARALWDLSAWADEAARLHEQLDVVGSLAEGFMATAEVIRHLLLDPALPEELLPEEWPGPALRERYVSFNETYAAQLRSYSEQ